MTFTLFSVFVCVFSLGVVRLTCFWPGVGEDSQGQQNEAQLYSELSHLHPDDTDLPDRLLGAGLGWKWNWVRV